MDLTSSQKDALTELINIGYARAAAALSDLTGHRITLEVPEVAIHLIPEIRERLQKVIVGEVASVNQIFSGPISGNAILLLDREAALLLNSLLTDRPGTAELDGAAREVITEDWQHRAERVPGSIRQSLKSPGHLYRPVVAGGERARKYSAP